METTTTLWYASLGLEASGGSTQTWSCSGNAGVARLWTRTLAIFPSLHPSPVLDTDL